jgi:hypothetical protein
VEHNVSHKFNVGQIVRCFGTPIGAIPEHRNFKILRQLPGLEYRIKSDDEPNERMIAESQIKPVSN